MSPKCRVQIHIAKMPKTMAIAVKDALTPDNIKFPQSQSIDMQVRDDSLVITIEGGTMGQFISTVDEVLEHVHIAIEATGQ